MAIAGDATPLISSPHGIKEEEEEDGELMELEQFTEAVKQRRKELGLPQVECDTVQEELLVKQDQMQEGRAATVDTPPLVSSDHDTKEEDVGLEELEWIAKAIRQRRELLDLSQRATGLMMGKMYGRRSCLSGNVISDFEILRMSFENMCKFKPLMQKWLDDTVPYLSDPAVMSRKSALSTEKRNKGKRYTRFMPEMRPFLEKSFQEQPYPSPEEYEAIAEQINLEERVVRNWFYGHRHRLREKLRSSNKFVKNRKDVVSAGSRIVLESSFLHQPNPTREGIALLGNQLSLEDSTIRNWFHKRRHSASHSASNSGCSPNVSRMQESAPDSPVTPSIPAGFDSAAPSCGSTKKKLTKIKPETWLVLEKSYIQEPWPSSKEYVVIAEQADLKKKVVINWFTNRRAFEKKSKRFKRRSFISVRHSLYLESTYLEQPDPIPERIALLGRQLNIEDKVVKNWFDDRRLKENCGDVLKSNDQDQMAQDGSSSESSSNRSSGFSRIQQSPPGGSNTSSTSSVFGPAVLSLKSVKSFKREKKFKRVPIDAKVRASLEKSFQQQPMPSPEEKRVLAKQLGLEYSRVKSWFTRRRQEEKLVNPSRVI